MGHVRMGSPLNTTKNKVIIISKDNKEINLEKMSKEKVARNLFDIILKKR